MTAQPNRRFWQIYLSTAVVVMLAAGCLVGANVLPRQGQPYKLHALDSQEAAVYDTTDFGHYLIRGWPLEFQRWYDGSNPIASAWLFVGWDREDLGLIAHRPLLADIAFGIIVLSMVAVVCERFFRRREARRRAAVSSPCVESSAR